MAKKPAKKRAPSAISVADMARNMDLGNTGYYESFTEEQIKAFSPWLAMKWASSVKDKDLAPHYLTMVNDFCNSNFSIISKHPNLFWKLLTIAGVGQAQYHTWIPPGKKGKKSKVQKFLATIYPTYKLADLEMLELVNSVDDLKALAETYGYDKKDIKEMFK